MARIPESELDRLKREVVLVRYEECKARNLVTKASGSYSRSLLSHKLLNELRIKDYSALIC